MTSKHLILKIILYPPVLPIHRQYISDTGHIHMILVKHIQPNSVVAESVHIVCDVINPLAAVFL